MSTRVEHEKGLPSRGLDPVIVREFSQGRLNSRGKLTEQRKADVVYPPTDDAWVGNFGALEYEENGNEGDKKWALGAVVNL